MAVKVILKNKLSSYHQNSSGMSDFKFLCCLSFPLEKLWNYLLNDDSWETISTRQNWLCLFIQWEWSLGKVYHQSDKKPYQSIVVEKAILAPRELLQQKVNHFVMAKYIAHLKIRTTCHAWDLWKLVWSCKQMHLLCLGEPWNLSGTALLSYAVDFKAPRDLWNPLRKI